MTRRSFVVAVLLSLLVGTALRTLWLRSDPPVYASVGIVYHDEGAWVHNARNQALWGEWRTDAWNPMFIAPVFTGLEYVAFRAFGVGTWQARSVPVVSGLASIMFLVIGLNAIAGRRAAVVGAVLLSTNYVFVMWNRAALMESTMTAFIVMGWAGYAVGERRPLWSGLAGVAAALAWFTKGSAAFFVAALVLDALATLVLARAAGLRQRLQIDAPSATQQRAAFAALATLGLSFAVAIAVFVWPNWQEYQFYNWQMTVTRKPDYTIRAFLDRASWLPLAQGFFSRMWLVVVAGAVAITAIVMRWRTARPSERLLVLWVVVGLAELVAHDAGNERRYVMFIPALIALTGWLLGDGRAVRDVRRGGLQPASLEAGLKAAPPYAVGLLVPLALVLGYLVFGSVIRLVFLDDVLANNYRMTVRLSTAVAAIVALAIAWRRESVTRWLNRLQMPAALVATFVSVSVVWNLFEYGSWAQRRDDRNYRASVALGRILPPGTLVQGKLANGLSLENTIRPIFVGNGFGNYEDRLRRDDVRYILTYDLPSVGFESGRLTGLIQGILDRYPTHRDVATFDVDETPDVDRAVLIDKFPNARD